ncbi:hypothetical protein N5938_16000 [Pseudomonas aeruginosa]|uniref:hypothetical protein n=1 Tax=Pseudomonas aeruginosa TaxID=287 RepID=UPI0021F0B641|nr:hypothetical protein [Pseudomonas aeruginosa]UYM64304.1 hypothetical protein N5938_16000 [Pseudomonas aeruginosa]
MTEFLAGSGRMNFPQTPQLFAGSLEVTTNRRPVKDGLKFAQYEVIAIVGDEIVKFDPAGTDGSEKGRRHFAGLGGYQRDRHHGPGLRVLYRG